MKRSKTAEMLEPEMQRVSHGNMHQSKPQSVFIVSAVQIYEFNMDLYVIYLLIYRLKSLELLFKKLQMYGKMLHLD